jgi:outer membrane lipoprotein-sorting protein
MKHSITLLLIVTGLAVAACGQSTQDEAKTQAQDKARTQLCDAHSDIQKQVKQLRGLTLATATVDGVTANLEAIRADLGKIEDAAGDLTGERKQQVTAANQAFEQQITATVKSLGRSLSLTQAAAQVQASLRQLADGYEQALGRIGCA